MQSDKYLDLTERVKGKGQVNCKGRDTRCDKSRRHVAATSRLVCTAAATRLYAYLVAAISRTNSNQFEFVRQIAATKFCRGDNYFHMSHGTICCSNLSRRRIAAICRIVCLGLNVFFLGGGIIESTIFEERN